MSSILLISNDNHLSQMMTNILISYFPSSGEKNLCINTKYYQCQVSILNKPWAILKQSDTQLNPQKQTYDFVLMLTEGTNSIQHQIIDQIIDQYQPASHILIANSKIDSLDNPLCQSIMQCNNFVEVIVQDLQTILKHKPKWQQSSLLNEQEDLKPIFSLFDLLHTTAWTDMKKKENQKNQQQMKIKSQQQQLKYKQKIKNQIPNQQMIQEELNEQKLEKQMMEFESIMSQMMSLKTSNYDDNIRKKKAEQLFNRLAKDML